MICSRCKHENTADEARCGLCGQRLHGPVLLADAHSNAAPKLEALEQRLVAEDVKSRQPHQGRLFAAQEPKRVIPFETISPEAARLARSTQERNAKTRVKQRLAERMGFAADGPLELQRELHFPEEAFAVRPVERVVYTNAPVAMPMHRAMATAYDLAMIAIGVGILVAIYYAGGVQFGLAKLDISTYVVVTLCVAFLYKLLWALSGGDTPGMRAVRLQLLNFDGQKPSREERLLRVLVSIVSFASMGLGLVWALFDEEKLTWHDHITKTFSSPKFES